MQLRQADREARDEERLARSGSRIQFEGNPDSLDASSWAILLSPVQLVVCFGKFSKSERALLWSERLSRLQHWTQPERVMMLLPMV